MMDKLIADQEAGKPTMVTIDGQMKRVCAEIFKAKDGVVFVDIGWNQIGGTSGHATHYVRGKTEGTIVTDKRGRVFHFEAIPEQDDTMLEWMAWEKWKRNQKKPYDRKIIERVVKRMISESEGPI